jgi:hypothetical protein
MIIRVLNLLKLKKISNYIIQNFKHIFELFPTHKQNIT